jgi:hypothetical protein
MEEALTARLLAATGLAALVGDRISWVERPQGEALPALTLQVISDPRPQHMQGFQDYRAARVQVDVWAADYLSAKQTSEAVIDAVVPAAEVAGIKFGRSFVDDARDLSERTETRTIHRKSIDFMIHHATA